MEYDSIQLKIGLNSTSKFNQASKYLYLWQSSTFILQPIYPKYLFLTSNFLDVITIYQGQPANVEQVTYLN